MIARISVYRPACQAINFREMQTEGRSVAQLVGVSVAGCRQMVSRYITYLSINDYIE